LDSLRVNVPFLAVFTVEFRIQGALNELSKQRLRGEVDFLQVRIPLWVDLHLDM
jgi:hypothetical protein